MINTIKKYKRGFALIDIEKEQNVWVYFKRSDDTYLVSTDPKFTSAHDMYYANLSDLKELHQKRSSSIKAKVKVLSPEQKDDKKERDQFFESLTIPALCQECDKPLIAFNSFARRSVSSHILPKAYFKSVATNPLNIMFLGAGFLGGCDCHGQWDTNVDNRVKMKVYDLAVKRFRQFQHLLNQDELNSALDYLNLRK